ncbi:MAG TPA: EAL domain-containing protein [Steroidobacteraceae bacterium]|nr:EAL domain-containing protein [Steroidobacteraceae bacterium]
MNGANTAFTSQGGGPAAAIIADDEDLGRLLLSESLQQLGLEVHACSSGSEALQAALTCEPAIVLLDVDMPGLDGYAVCRRLRDDPRFANVPIVMVTGHEDATAVRRAFEAGATDFISKPVNWSLLPRRLEYILRNAASASHIERLAYFDALTGLPNRQRCLETAQRFFAAARTEGEAVAVLYMDLNNFKRINDTFGHGVGDAVLRAVAGRLRGALDEAAGPGSGAGIDVPQLCLARFGGDEFVILLRHAQARAHALRVAEACCAAFHEPVIHDGLEFYPAPSIGLAVHPDDGADVETVLKHADTAMYQAKMGAVARVAAYSPAMSSRLRDWLELEARLRHALRDDRLQLLFQPKFRLTDNRLAGVEALLRWCDAEYGDVSPTRFVEIAEESGLIIDIGAWVTRTACRQLRAWLERGITVPVAINVSGKELLHGDPARVIEAETAAAGVPASLIEVEITESLLVKDSAKVRDALDRLRRLGCRIALDDFGTGYSSLAYITRFPPDRIKIDQAFAKQLDNSPRDAAVASAILSLGQSLGVVVTAEGIERGAQLEWLRARGCDEVQGFLLARPLSALELERRFLQRDQADAPGGAAGRPAREGRGY